MTNDKGQMTAFDPYALPPEAVEPPPVTLGRALRRIGPGLILAGAIVGTGELIATTDLGARFGFSLLWLVLLSCFIKVFVQVELGRHAISSGQTTLASFASLPGPGKLLVWWYVVMTLITELQLAAMVGGVGQAIHLAIPSVTPRLCFGIAYLQANPALPWAILVALVTIALLYRGTYGTVESANTIMVVAFTIMTVVCVALLPASGHSIDWHSVGQGMLVGLPHDSSGALLPGVTIAAMAVIGITGVGASELIAYPYWCIEKGYARYAGLRDDSAAWLARARGWLRIMKLDAFVCLAIYTLATVAFYFLGAAVLHPAGKNLDGKVDRMLATLSSMYSPVMGPRLAIAFIIIGVFAVLYSTFFTSTAANARGLADSLHVTGVINIDSAGRRRFWIRVFCIATPLLNLVLFILLKNPVKMVQIGAFSQALTLPMIGCATLFLRYRRTDARLRPSRWWDLFLWLSVAAFFLAASYGMFDAVRRIIKAGA